ncbi:Oxysterol-binding family protein [Colletotrichum higginsianum IMI 349063]|uniref:Oxysterol-binding family protein n=1 Tax=Colletotrichum higginsianum (strain IMI 349063) TaxID=759273 RepID=A0A1B7YVY8_COLHI|nr:Oxysterol-binding family protein [Colletotrichum higginsianum IMI 349063]OBR16114.1 Oxysterol-binding family protein [Colletotrichum higginsianum IMI 349063]
MAAAAAHDTPEEPQSDGSKLKTFIGILKNEENVIGLAIKQNQTEAAFQQTSSWLTDCVFRSRFIGVADLAAVRFSLPSQLLEPTPNLEYWNYLDAPNAFVAIGTSDEPLDRMLEVCRFWFTKDLKYVKGKPCKPYNSCLGEFFRCNWETEDNAPKINTTALKGAGSGTASSSSSFKSAKGDKNASVASLSVPQHGTSTPDSKLLRISYLTEQTSHHPPVSAFHISCPEKGLSARGFDQITAKFTGTSVRVLPGEHNLGIFVTLEKRGGETYRLTHPAAHLGGILRGSLSVSVSEMAYITCPQTKLKTILHYVEAGWLGRSTNRVEGIIFKYDPENDDKVNIKDVPEADIVARLSGPWREKIEFTLGPKPVNSHPPEARYTIIDLNPLSVAPKVLPPKEKQLENESLTMWGGVTEAIHSKQFSRATQVKVELEERQRELARERERTGEVFKPVFFEQVTDQGGKPELTEKGREVLARAQKADWDMSGIV